MKSLWDYLLMLLLTQRVKRDGCCEGFCGKGGEDIVAKEYFMRSIIFEAKF